MMDLELEKLHHGSTSSESQVNSPVITTPVLFQTIHVDIHENERWFPIIGWGTSRLPNDLPNFTPVMFTHILDDVTSTEEQAKAQSFAETKLSHQHSILAPSVAAFHRAFQESLVQNAVNHTNNSENNYDKSSKNRLTQINRRMCSSMPIRPLHIQLPQGYAWNGFWEVAKTHDKGTDSAGWRYASDFIASPTERALHSTPEQLPNYKEERESQKESNIHDEHEHYNSNDKAETVQKNINTETSQRTIDNATNAAEHHRAIQESATCASDQHSDETERSIQSNITTETYSRARFKKTQTPICVARYRTWRRQVKVVISPQTWTDSTTKGNADSMTHDTNANTSPNKDASTRESVNTDHVPHSEHHAMPTSDTRKTPTKTQQGSEELQPTLSNLTLDEYTLTEEDEVNELYLQQKEAEMMLAESLKQRRLQILSSGQEWTQEMDLAAEEELRNFIRENRIRVQQESASSHKRSANRSFANPFFHEFATDNSESGENVDEHHTIPHDANRNNVNGSNNVINENRHFNNFNIDFNPQGGDASQLDVRYTYNTCPEFGENKERDIARESNNAEWVMEMQLKDSFNRSAGQQSPFSRNEHYDSSSYLHTTFNPINTADAINNNVNNKSNHYAGEKGDSDRVLEFHSHSVLPNRVDGEDTQVIVNKFVAASPHEDDNDDNNNDNDGSDSNTSRNSNVFAEDNGHDTSSVLVDGGNDFDSIFQKFVSNPETRHA